MISSGALPNVALRKPPMPAPVWWAACSVASPISHASGTSDSGGEHEVDGRARVDDLVNEDRDRREGE